MEFGVFDNRLQFKSPSKYDSKFSTSILSIISSNKVIDSWGELGGLYQVSTKNGLEISTDRNSRSLLVVLDQHFDTGSDVTTGSDGTGSDVTTLITQPEVTSQPEVTAPEVTSYPTFS